MLNNLFLTRRSIRVFSDEDIEANDLAQILQAGLAAPSSRNSRPWHFIVVEGKERLQRLSECKPSGAHFIKNAKIAIIVAADAEKTDMWIEDASIAATYMQLQAEELGIGSCWVQIRGRITNDDQYSEDYIQEMFGIPPTVSVECVLALGHKAEKKEAHHEDELMWERVHINSWKQE